MKTISLWLLPLLSITSVTAGVNVTTFNPNLLIPNQPNGTEVAFKGGSSMVRLTDGDFFKMQGFGDRVEFQSVSNKDWFFDNKVIYTWELPLTSLNNISDSDILTITATSLHNAATEYNVNVIKYMKNNRMMLRVVSVGIVPEPEAFALFAGMVALSVIALRHRNK